MATAENPATPWNVVGDAIKQLSWIVRGVWFLVVFFVASAFGLGGFLATINARVANMEGSVSRLETTLMTDYNQRLRHVEAAIAPGILGQAKVDIEKIEKRLRDLESEAKR